MAKAEQPAATPRGNTLKPAPERAKAVPPRSTDKGDLPAGMLDRYLIERDRRGRAERFYRDHRATEPAFRDFGRRLQTGLAYPDVIADMLKVAEHRGWTRLRVEGDERFRREAWIQARARGLEVAGYRPRERDRQAAGETSPSRSPGRERFERAAAIVRALIPNTEAQTRILAAAWSKLQSRQPVRSRPSERER